MRQLQVQVADSKIILPDQPPQAASYMIGIWPLPDPTPINILGHPLRPRAWSLRLFFYFSSGQHPRPMRQRQRQSPAWLAILLKRFAPNLARIDDQARKHAPQIRRWRRCTVAPAGHSCLFQNLGTRSLRRLRSAGRKDPPIPLTCGARCAQPPSATRRISKPMHVIIALGLGARHAQQRGISPAGMRLPAAGDYVYYFETQDWMSDEERRHR